MKVDNKIFFLIPLGLLFLSCVSSVQVVESVATGTKTETIENKITNKKTVKQFKNGKLIRTDVYKKVGENWVLDNKKVIEDDAK